jgi:hypothetical protein
MGIRQIMRRMREPSGDATMSETMRKLARMIAQGLALSARATAWREGHRWEPDERAAGEPAPPVISKAYPGASLCRPRIQK